MNRRRELSTFHSFCKAVPACLIYLRTLSRVTGIVTCFISLETERIKVIFEQLSMKIELLLQVVFLLLSHSVILAPGGKKTVNIIGKYMKWNVVRIVCFIH
jgi:hypothetical protein